MGERPKLLWHSNAPHTVTGYGQQTALFAPLLAEHYDLAISSFYGLEGAPMGWNGITMLPGLGGEFGNATISQHAGFHFGGDPKDGLVVTLMDTWVLEPQVFSQMNVASWVPVDHDPVPPAVARFFQESGAVPIAMSRFGQEQLEPLGALYVPHAVDVDTYKPQDRTVSRAAVGLPEDAFVVGMVAANKGRPSRKGFQEAFEAFRFFREKHDNAHLYLHTTVSPEYANGEDIPTLLASLEIPEECVSFSSQYRAMYLPWTREEMATIYSTFDVLVNPAHGEGFGIPVLEAQACGVPCIVSDFTAMKEVCGAGWKVPVRPRWTNQKSWQGIAEVGSILDSLEKCIRMNKTERTSLSKKARRHALNYALPKVFKEHMLPAIKEAEERLNPKVSVEVEA